MAVYRTALYVYSKTAATIDPASPPVELMAMATDYAAVPEATISGLTEVTLYPGVYGYTHEGDPGLTAPEVTVVTVDKSNPWPTPPPPPPPPFVGRRDWADHLGVFLV